MRILIVDDEPEIARALGRLLRAHEVDLAHSPEEALAAARGTTYDAVVSDVDLPGMSGPDLCLEICRLAASRAVTPPRIVFHTGRILWAPPPELAFAAVLYKPCLKEDLFDALRCT